jgi:hypothetical protein
MKPDFLSSLSTNPVHGGPEGQKLTGDIDKLMPPSIFGSSGGG